VRQSWSGPDDSTWWPARVSGSPELVVELRRRQD
jgi:hypothetical protein